MGGGDIGGQRDRLIIYSIDQDSMGPSKDPS